MRKEKMQQESPFNDYKPRETYRQPAPASNNFRQPAPASNNFRNSTPTGILRRPMASMRNYPSAEDTMESQGREDNNNINNRIDEIPPATPDRIGAGNARGAQGN